MAASISQPAASKILKRRRDAVAFGPLAVGLAGRLAFGTLVVAAAIVVSRRLAGGLDAPPWFPAIVAAAFAGASLVVLSDRAGSVAAGMRLRGWLARGCLLIAVGGLGLFAANPTVAAATGVLLLGIAVGLFPVRLPGRQLPALRLPRLPLRRQGPPSPPGSTAAASPRPPRLAGERLQWQERYRLPDGREHLRGELVMTLAAESRLATGHIGFCPAFPVVPEVDVSTDYDALEVAVAAAEVLPWGVRVECRVEESTDEPVSIPVSITVSQPATRQPLLSPALQAD